MGNQDGIVSGFFTALVHALLALLVLFFASGGVGPYTSVTVIACVVMLVCCIGLVVRSHFSSILLLVLDITFMGLAVAWCVSTVIAFQSPPSPAAGWLGVTQTLEKASDVATIVAAAMAFLLAAWLARRAFRLEKRLRMSHRRCDRIRHD